MDEFELFEELGKGNYGTVQKVVHRPTGVTMALKVRAALLWPRKTLLRTDRSSRASRKSASSSTTRS